MARWKKLLGGMVNDASPTTYTYDDAVAVLRQLGFELAPHGGGSHRMWRLRDPAGNTVVIGLVDRGAGPLKAYLIRDMVRQLRANGLIPSERE
jgi:predicted RNA binding protein YcfA (HicA-like mRNA interferase family)